MRFILTLLFVIKIFCLNSQTTKPDSIKIIESTFRYLFSHNASAIKNNATYYYISIEDSTTSITVDDIIPRLSDTKPQVKNDKDFISLKNYLPMTIREYKPADKEKCLEIFASNCPKFFDIEEREPFVKWLG